MSGSRAVRLSSALVILVMLVWAAASAPAAFAGSLPAPTWGFQQALYAEPPQADAHFGQAVAISGDTIVVGEPDRVVPVPGTTAIKSGVVSVYVRTAGVWTLQAQLLPTPMHADDHFGAAVAIDGDIVVVGAPDFHVDGTTHGAAFVYRRTGTAWSSATALAGGQSDDWEYGASVAVDGTTIAVGAPGANGRTGLAKVFALVGSAWYAQGTLTDPTPVAGDALGGSVAVVGDTIFAGATGDTYPESGSPQVMTAGSVHVFKLTAVAGWQPTQTLFAPVPHAAELFGGPIAASGTRMLASAWMPMGPGGSVGPGVVYAFAQQPGGAWSYETSLTAPVPEPNGYFGSGVGLDGDSAVVGAFFANSYKGRAYFYSHASGSWQLVQQVDMSSHSPAVVQLGTSAGLSGDTAVLGAQMAFAPTVATPGSGGAYVFKSPANLWGVVTNAATGLPVAGIEMSAYVPGQGGDPDLAGITYSDANGLYALSLPAGTYALGWMDGSGTYRPGFYNEVQYWPDATMVPVPATPPTRIDVAIHPYLKVWRFYNFKKGTHFYTASEIEKNDVIARLSYTFRFEGVAYRINDSSASNGAPLYRFYNFRKGTHFYTASLVEKQDVERRLWWTFRYEGVAYDVCLTPVTGATPVYRFFNFRNGTHFYTASPVERADVLRRLSWTFRDEGIAYYLAP